MLPPGHRPTSVPSGILIHPTVWPQYMGRKLRELLCRPFVEGSWVPIQHNVARAKAYLRAKFHLDPSNRLATIHQHYRQTEQDRETGQWSNSI